MAIEKELLDELLAGRDPSEVFGKDGLLDDLKKALSERIVNAELDEHLCWFPCGTEPVFPPRSEPPLMRHVCG